MRINVPIYINQRSDRRGTPIVARPLFFSSPEKSGGELGRVIAGLRDQLRIRFADLAQSNNHEELLRWHEVRSIDHKLVKLQLDLRDSTARLKLMVVIVKRFDTQLVFSPSLPSVWFDLLPGEHVETRAREVFESYFQELRRDVPDYPVASHGFQGKAWIDHITIDVAPKPQPKVSKDPFRAFLGGEDVSDGAAELRKTGRCLNWIDIDELADPICVDDDVHRLTQLLCVGDRRGVVLIGPSGSGKTARIEGVARARRNSKKDPTKRLIWHLSPARLISGMSYLGQWQERVLGIIKHAHRNDHVLYFDDFLSLYEAGKTRDSMMCVADVLRAQQDVRPVRLLTEMTPQAWAILRERDRTLANRFVVVPTAALSAKQSMRIMIGVRQRIEANKRCKFDSDVLPEIISMYDRFERSSVLPGKAVAAMCRLAGRSKNQTVQREQAIDEFQSRSGLQASIIDRSIKFSRDQITKRIREQVVGQDKPVAKLVDRVMVAAARVNDTSRPIGTFLLVGPTGVGKTQLAKAVASCLFDVGGLIRLDMNELASPSSASRLVGTFESPDGLLTSAVRRRPNAVLLLDEIEKAHPSVLDVLLQALGEARLSDARGRTVDLSGMLILMTSNLGARTSGRSNGFTGSGDRTRIEENHMKAVKAFFRPEFFNRIDDVLCFDRLSRDVVESIAKIQFREILKRDGLQRRSVLIDIDPETIRETALRGYDPAMGARALKRQIERDLIRPAAKVLAATKTDQPTLLRLHFDTSPTQTSLEDSANSTERQVRAHWQPIEYVDPYPSATRWSVNELCDRADAWLDSVSPTIQGGPLSFEISGSGVDPGVLETMTLRDSLLECRQSIAVLRELMDRPQLQRPSSAPVQPATQQQPEYRFIPGPRVGLKDIQAVEDIQDYLRDSLVVTKPGDADPIRNQLINQLGRLHRQMECRGTATRWMVWIRWYGEQSAIDVGDVAYANHSDRLILHTALSMWARDNESLMIEDTGIRTDRVTEFAGALAQASIAECCGSWMFVNRNGQLKMADVRMRSIVDDGRSVPEQFVAWKYGADRKPVAPVRRVIQNNRPLVDLQTGAVSNMRSRSDLVDADAIVRLLQQSRRSLQFLNEFGVKANEVTS